MRLPDMVNGGLVPAVVSFGATGMLMAASDRRQRVLRAPYGPALGVAVAFVPLAGGLPILAGVPHRATGQVTIAALALIPLFNRLSGRLGLARILGALACTAAALWVAGLDDATGIVLAFATGAVAALYLARLGAPPSDEHAAALPILVALALGLGFVGAAAHAPLPASLACAVAAAVASAAAQGQSPGAAARGLRPELIPALIVLSAIAVDLGATALHPAWGLPILALGAVAGTVARRLPGLDRLRKRRAGRRIVTAGAAILPALAAFLVTWAGAALAP